LSSSTGALHPIGLLVGADGNAVVEEVGDRQLEASKLHLEFLRLALDLFDFLAE